MLLLDTVSGELSWHNKPLARLNRSETLLLEHLIEHQGLLVSRDNLLDAGWPQTVVAPNSLVVAINNIRKNLSKTQVSIETVHGRGYVFNPGENIVRTIITEIRQTSVNVSIDKNTDENIGGLDTTYSAYETSVDESPKQDALISNNVKDEVFFEVCKAIISRFYYFYMIFKTVAFYIFIVLSILAALLIYDFTHEWYCYEMGDSSACGLFKLNDFQKDEITGELKEQPGRFLYGYENDFSKIKVYKIY